MLFSLCNEVLREYDFGEQCQIAAKLGYDGLEIAPFTLTDDPFSLTDSQIIAYRKIAGNEGLVVTGLHWLLVAPEGLSVTSDNPATAQRTADLMARLVEICALFGGSTLVHGSPKQRLLEHATSPDAARRSAKALFSKVALLAEAAKVTYCIEPLSANQTDFINTVAEAIALVEEIGSPAFKTMLDTASAGNQEALSVAETIRTYWPSGHLAHIQVNDTNLRAPGQGDNLFAPIFRALRDVGYDGTVSAEPFVYEPNGLATATHAIAYIRGVVEAL